MRLNAPRYAPLPQDAVLTEEQQEIIDGLNAHARPLNLFRTLLHAPKAMRGSLALGNYIQGRSNDLKPREREIVILRVGFLCKAGYEWAQHALIGARIGLTAEEIERIKVGAHAPDWSDADHALIAACDELHADQFIGESTWAALSRHFTDKQRMDVVFTAGHYVRVCMVLNTFGVQLDPGLTLDPDLAQLAD